MSNIENNNSSVEAIIEGAETGNIDSNSQTPSNNTPSVEEKREPSAEEIAAAQRQAKIKSDMKRVEEARKNLENDHYLETIFEFSLCKGGYCIKRYKGSDAEITIPSMYKGKPVVSIGSYCFNYYKDGNYSGNKNITKVTIPSSVKVIGYCAFEGCSNLTDVTIPSSVWKVGIDVFADCPHAIIKCRSKKKGLFWKKYWNGDCPVVYDYDGE